MRIPILSNLLDTWHRNWARKRSSLFADSLQDALVASFGKGGRSTARDQLKSNIGWLYAANRQIGGRAARVPARLHMVSEKKRSSRFQHYDPNFLLANQRAHHQSTDVVWDHPFLDLLCNPNPDESGLVFHWRQILQLQTVGRYYVLVIPEVFDIESPENPNKKWVISRIKQMRLLDPDRVAAVPKDGRAAGEFEYSPPRGVTMQFRAPPHTRGERRQWRREPYPFVFRNVFPSAKGYDGKGPVEAGELAVDNMESLNKLHQNQLKNGIHSGLVFNLLQNTDDPERFRQLVVLLKTGLGKAGEPLIVQKGRFEVEKSPVTNQDMQFPELADRSRQEALSVSGASDTLVGLIKDINRANIWGMEHILAVGTIDPLNDLISDAYNSWMLPLYPGQSDRQFLEMDYLSSRLVDEKDQAMILKVLVDAGLLTPNEGRAELGREPLPGGDELKKGQGSMVEADPGDSVPTQVEAEEEEAEAEKRMGWCPSCRAIQPVGGSMCWKCGGREVQVARRYLVRESEDGEEQVFDLATDEGREALWRDMMARQAPFEEAMQEGMADLFGEMEEVVLERLDDHGEDLFGELAAEAEAEELEEDERTRLLEDAAARQLEKLWDPDEWSDALREVFESHIPEPVLNALNQTMDDVGLASAFSVADPLIETFVTQESFRFVKQITRTTQKQLQEMLVSALDEGIGPLEFTRRIEAKFSEYQSTRAVTIARNEITHAQNWGSFRGMEQAKKQIPDMKHMWISARDGRVRPTHIQADGQVRRIGEYFTVGACNMKHPQDYGSCADPAELILCRCRATPIVPASLDLPVAA